MTAEGKRTDFSPLSEHDGLIERYKSKNLEGILELHNKTHVWNDETQSYVLNFHGRVTQVAQSVPWVYIIRFCSEFFFRECFYSIFKNPLLSTYDDNVYLF